MQDRRAFLKRAGAAGTIALTAGLSGCASGGNTNEDGGDGGSDGNSSDGGSDGGSGGTTMGDANGDTTINFVLTPAESDVAVEDQYAGVFDYLESETGATVESTVAADYPAVYESLRSDQADMADASPTLAVVGTNDGVVDIAGIRVAFGAAKYFSLITSHPDNDVSELADLQGKEVAFADRLSTSGSLFPLYYMDQAGLDIGNAPDGNPNDFSGSWSDHGSASEAVKNNQVAAAGTGAFVTADHIPDDQFPEQFMEISAEASPDEGPADPQLDLLKCSDPIPRAPILSRSNWDADVRSQAEEALLNAEAEDLQNDNDAEDIWFTGLQEGSAEDYQPVADVKNALGLEFGN